MTACISCGRPNGDPSKQLPKMHVRCWLNIPEVTRTQYLHGSSVVDLRRLVEASRRANSSVKKYGGGHGR